LVAAALHAQVPREILQADAAAVAACVAAAESRAALDPCRGSVSADCLRVEGSETTAGSIRCYERERAAWESELRTSVEALLTQDEDAAELLRVAQAAWLAWRAAKCSHDASIYLGGSAAGVVSASCFATETAARAIELAARRRGPDFMFATGEPAAEPLAAEVGAPFSLARGEQALVAAADLKVELIAVGRRRCADGAACAAADSPYALVRLARASTDTTLYAGEVSTAVAEFPHFADPTTREPYGVLFVGSDGRTSARLVAYGADRCTLFAARSAEAQCWLRVALYTGRPDFCDRAPLPEAVQSCKARLAPVADEESRDDPPLPAEGIAEIGIERSGCDGRCPSYVLVFRSNGTARYEGRQYVERLGTFSGTIPLQRFAALARFVEDSGFSDLEDFYSWNVTDAATVTTTVVADGVRKTVRNYAGGGPARLENLEKRIDALLDEAVWEPAP
jgi:uncharacterized protein YecT (DUF1311 family)